MHGAILVLIWASSITIDSGLISLEYFKDRIQLPDKVCGHTSDQNTFEISTSFGVLNTHDNELLKSFTIRCDTAYSQDNVNSSDEDHGSVDIADKKVLVSARSIKSWYDLNALVSTPLLANAVHEVWIERVNPRDVLSLGSLVVLDLKFFH